LRSASARSVKPLSIAAYSLVNFASASAVCRRGSAILSFTAVEALHHAVGLQCVRAQIVSDDTP
jgi:hypothetical protein